MVDSIYQLLNKLPVLGAKKNVNWACAIGFLFGGIGLAIYFRSVVDFIIPMAIAFVVIYVAGDIGILGGMVLASVYGYFRTQNSNERLDSLETANAAGSHVA